MTYACMRLPEPYSQNICSDGGRWSTSTPPIADDVLGLVNLGRDLIHIYLSYAYTDRSPSLTSHTVGDTDERVAISEGAATIYLFAKESQGQKAGGPGRDRSIDWLRPIRPAEYLYLSISVFPLETSIFLERLPLERERYKKKIASAALPLPPRTD